MAKHETAELDGTQLAIAVGLAAGIPFYCMESNWPGNGAIYGLTREHGAILIRDLLGGVHIERAIGGTEEWEPHIRWSQGGPFIERERITVSWAPMLGLWRAGFFHSATHIDLSHKGEMPLVAAMRAFVAAKLGGEVELPEVAA